MLFITYLKYFFIYSTDVNTDRYKSVKCKPVTLHAACVSTFKNIYPQFSVHFLVEEREKQTVKFDLLAGNKLLSLSPLTVICCPCEHQQ